MANYSEIGSGGAVGGGSGKAFTIYSTKISGGAVSGGTVKARIIYYSRISGGAVGGGDASVISKILVTGGAVGGGDAINSIYYSQKLSGGAVGGGNALLETPVLHYPNSLPWVNNITIGSSPKIAIGKKISSDGGVIIGGSPTIAATFKYLTEGNSNDAFPNFSGISIGYFNSINPTIVSQSMNIDFDFSWDTDSYISLDFDFSWNTGKLRQYWYRIVGKGKPNVCPPVTTSDNCCMKMILNIHASTINDLCEKLKARKWKWPIDIVQRFSKPQSNLAVAEDAANGIDYNCNEAVEVDVCTNLICQEFCIDYDIVEYIGGNFTTNIKKYYDVISADGISLGGSAEYSYAIYKYEANYESSGGISVSGSSKVVSNHYDYSSTGGLTLGSNYTLKATDFNFIGGQYPYSTNISSPKNSGLGTATNINEQIWNLPDRALKEDNLYSIADVSYLKNSRFLIVDNFGFDIPYDKKIIGIEASVKRHSVGSVKDFEVYLTVGDEIVSDNLANVDLNWPVAMDATITYGSLSNDWRDKNSPEYLGDWDIDDINNPEFGFAISVIGDSNISGVLAKIDNIQIKIYYEALDNQKINLSGSALVKSSNYSYIPSGGITLRSTPVYKIDRKYVSSGRGDIGPLFSAIEIGGTYERHFHFTSTGGLSIDGVGKIKSSHWSTSSTGGLSIDGSARFRSTAYKHVSSGGLAIESNYLFKNSYKYLSSGGFTVSGQTDVMNNFNYTSSGGIILGSKTRVVSSAFKWVSDGNVLFIGGSASIKYADLGDSIEYFGFDMGIQDLLIVYGSDELETETITPPTTTLNKCNCTSLPLVMFYSHNMFFKNKLEQFLNRNNITLPKSGSLLYNKINDSWQYNIHLQGFTPESNPTFNSKEKWNIIFDLQCTNIIGGQTIGQNVWKLTAQFIKKNLITLQDFDTRILIGFLPENTCIANNFRTILNLDVVRATATANQNITIYQTILYDNIGLFKNSYWLNNPNIVFSVSENGISDNAVRYPLNIK